MNRCRFIVLSAVLALALCAVGCGNKEQAELEAQYAENQTLRAQKQQLQEQIAQTAQREDELTAQMALQEAQLAAKDAAIAELTAQLTAKPKPTPAAAGWQAGEYTDKVTVGGDILFRSGQATLTPKGKATLDKIARDLTGSYAGLPVRVYGYTDSDPIKRTAKLWVDNLDLSQARAAAVTRYLIAKGIAAEQMETIGMGPTHPVTSNATRAGKAKNRRVEIVVVKSPKTKQQ